jgi:hypothetical protein
MTDLDPKALDAACNKMWPLSDLSSEDAREQLRGDMRNAIQTYNALTREPSLIRTVRKVRSAIVGLLDSQHAEHYGGSWESCEWCAEGASALEQLDAVLGEDGYK